MNPPADALESLARFHGIRTSYVDASGVTQRVSCEAVRAILEALGVRADSDRTVRTALREAEEARGKEAVEPVYVVWGSRNLSSKVRVPAGVKSCGLRLEDGSGQQLEVSCDGEVDLQGLPFGYHQLEVDARNRTYSSLVICAPWRAYALPAGKRRWGIFVPPYALHCGNSWGAGDFADCRNLADWLGTMGADVLALLPMMAAFLDRPCDPSPYSPISRFFWNEFYLHVPAIAEFSHCARARKLVESPGFQRKVNDFRGQPLVDYQKQMRLKRSVLERLSEFFFSTASSRRDQFERFLKTRPELRQYAAFRAVTERLHQGWRKWPERLRQGDLRPGDYDVRSEQYHMFVQWCAQQQIDSLRCASTILYLDMPLGVHADGFDTWREHEVFVTDVSGGAPPDPFFTKGQDWGFAPLHPQALRRSRYRYYIDMLRFAMRHTGLLRLDHVMGLHRLYWVPKGFPASEGAYVSYPAEELYAILCLESQRHKTALVGENLGTVPPEVNQAMARHRLSQMYVVQYEQQPYSKKCLRPPPKDSVASLNTHDMPPFSAHWKGLDVPDRVSLGLLTQEQAAAEKRRRQKNHQALAEFLRRRGFLKRSRKTSPQATIRSCLRFLSRSQAELVLVNLEDLWQEVRPQNTPGTCRERPNWRCKTRLSIEQVLASEQCRAALAEVKRLRRRAST